MSKYTVTVIDTAAIQNYVFGSNSLQHNVGASGLVHYATHDWVFEDLVKMDKTNIDSNHELNKKTIENDDLKSELVYAGGGNTVIIFKKKNIAKEFTKELTRRVLIESPGLQLIIAHKDFEWGDSNLAKTVSDILGDVNRKKYNRQFSTPLLGLGVTADCQYTGLPAVDIRVKSERNTKNKVWISSEVAKKLDFFGLATGRLRKNFFLKNNYEYVSNFNDFGVKHESSYMAVVHADGNGMGKRVQDIADKHSEDNRKYIEAIREFSISVEHATKTALQTSIDRLQDSIDKVDKVDKISGVVEIYENDRGKKLLPFRPIVFGGDDVTFVCDGRLGLTLAELYLRELASPDLKLTDGYPIYARAGIAIVKTHYPFSRAFVLAENLAKSAKKYILENQKSDENSLLAIDWHFAASGPIGDLDDIRKREYTVDSGKLYMRPVRLGKSVGSDWHSWDTFTYIMEKFQDNWADKRNKIMSLRDALRAGPETVEQFVTLHVPQKLPEIKTDSDSDTRGWVDKCCTCFDAIEAMDFFVPLKDEGGGK